MPANSVTYLSPAKINLYLEITGKRKDGYHNIATIFQMIDLYDKIRFTPANNGTIKLTCNIKTIPVKKNLVYKAVNSLWKPGMPGISIHLEKNIPSGAGLGGGSSNAAITLFALNKLWKLNYTNKKLRSIAKTIGADVPFFLFSHRAYATGIGEKLTNIRDSENFHILLVKPRISISTKDIYENYIPGLTNRGNLDTMRNNCKGLILFEDTILNLRNDLESKVLQKHPVIREIKSVLYKFNSKGVMISGSGSTVFALFRNFRDAENAHTAVSGKRWWCCMAKPLGSLKHLK